MKNNYCKYCHKETEFFETNYFLQRKKVEDSFEYGMCYPITINSQTIIQRIFFDKSNISGNDQILLNAIFNDEDKKNITIIKTTTTFLICGIKKSSISYDLSVSAKDKNFNDIYCTLEIQNKYKTIFNNFISILKNDKTIL